MNVMIVDDNPSICKLIARMLKSEYMDSEVFTNPIVALNALRNGEVNPDVILLDILMPMLNGYEFIEQLKGNPRTENQKVILMTAHKEFPGYISQDPIRQQVEFIRKPLEMNNLLSKINLVTNWALIGLNLQERRLFLSFRKDRLWLKANFIVLISPIL